MLRGPALAILLVAALAAVSSAHAKLAIAPVGSQDVTAAPVVSEQSGTATANFRIQLVNQDEVDFTVVKVIFPGDVQVPMADIAAGTTGLSDPQTMQFDTSTMPPTQSLPIPVTLDFFVGGTETQMPMILSFTRGGSHHE
jgi:hypothetical protein